MPSADATVPVVEVAEFQELMETLYGEGDRERGIPATVAWLCEELGELAQAVRKGTREDQLHELGDVFAWLATKHGKRVTPAEVCAALMAMGFVDATERRRR